MLDSSPPIQHSEKQPGFYDSGLAYRTNFIFYFYCEPRRGEARNLDSAIGTKFFSSLCLCVCMFHFFSKTNWHIELQSLELGREKSGKGFKTRLLRLVE